MQGLGLEGENFGAILIPVVFGLPNEFNKHLTRANENGFNWDITKLLEVMKKELKIMDSGTTSTGNINPFYSSDNSTVSACLEIVRTLLFTQMPKFVCFRICLTNIQ